MANETLKGWLGKFLPQKFIGAFTKENKLVEILGLDSQYTQQYNEIYKGVKPISDAINRYSSDCSRIKAELQDDKGYTKQDKFLLDKYYHFLHNAYSFNGISSLYSNLVKQIITSISLQSEFFIRLVYLKNKDAFMGVEFIPSNKCIHYTGNDGYIDYFTVRGAVNNLYHDEYYDRLKTYGQGNVYKYNPNKFENNKKIAEGVEMYLIHYVFNNGVNCQDFSMYNMQQDNFSSVFQADQGLRGQSVLDNMKSDIETYLLLENARKYFLKGENLQRGITSVYTTDTKDMTDLTNKIGNAKTPLQSSKITKSNILDPEIASLLKRGLFISTDNMKEAKKGVTYTSREHDFKKDFTPICEELKEVEKSLLKSLGIPLRLAGTEGAAYNNLAVATDDYERNLLSSMEDIFQCLTVSMQQISPSFKSQQIKITVNKKSSPYERKLIAEEMKSLEGITSINEKRDIQDFRPIKNGDVILEVAKPTGELSREDAVNQKRKLPENNGRTVIKKNT